MEPIEGKGECTELVKAGAQVNLWMGIEESTEKERGRERNCSEEGKEGEGKASAHPGPPSW